MRNKEDIYEPTEIINDENGNALKEPKQIRERWQQYFKELLNLKEGGEDTTINTTIANLEPNILLSEIEMQ